MSRPTAAPVVQTARHRGAHQAVSGSLFPFTQVAWSGRCLALLALAIGIIAGFLAPGATLSADDPELYPGGDRAARSEVDWAEIDRAGLSKSAASAGAVLVGVERGTPPSFGVELEAAEFEQEDQEESKGVATDAGRTRVPGFSSNADERFRRAVFAFVTRIGDLRDLPRGPPSHA